MGAGLDVRHTGRVRYELLHATSVRERGGHWSHVSITGHFCRVRAGKFTLVKLV